MAKGSGNSCSANGCGYGGCGCSCTVAVSKRRCSGGARARQIPNKRVELSVSPNLGYDLIPIPGPHDSEAQYAIKRVPCVISAALLEAARCRDVESRTHGKQTLNDLLVDPHSASATNKYRHAAALFKPQPYAPHSLE